VSCSNGPGGEAGTIWEAIGSSTHSISQSPIGYYPDVQKWSLYGEVWIGYNKGFPPRPIDMRREQTLVPGLEITLQDKNLYTIPVVRDLTGGSSIPRFITLHEGEAVRSIKSQYIDLFQRLKKMADEILSDDAAGGEWTEIELAKLAADGLDINYLIGIPEMAALELADDEDLLEMANTMLGKQGLMSLVSEIQQKKTASCA